MAFAIRLALSWWLVAGVVAAVYCVTNLVLPRVPISGQLGAFVVRPIILGLLIWLVLTLPAGRGSAKLRLRGALMTLALATAVSQIVLGMIVGISAGLGRSPYNFTFPAVLLNIMLATAALLATELSRAWLLNHLGKTSMLPIICGVTLFYTLMDISLLKFTSLEGPIEWVRFISGTLLPAMAENLLASVLAFLGGPWPAIAYRGVLAAFEWFFPLQPNLGWAVKGLLGVGLPVLGLVAVAKIWARQSGPRAARRKRDDAFPLGWIMTSIVGVAAMWFSAGMFNWQPTTIVSGSMRPTLDVGHLVIVEKASVADIRQGNIIEFMQGDTKIVHRVVGMQESGSITVLTTKGDANSQADPDPVTPEQLVGKIVLAIPKVGWASIAIRELLAGRWH